jgi:beta-glucosidase
MLSTVDIAQVVLDGDLDVISQPIDALGVNYYQPTVVAAAGPDDQLPFAIAPLPGYPVTDFGWPIVPDGLRETLVLLRNRYEKALPPIWITESGCSFATVEDEQRVSYLDGHIKAVRTAIDEGVDVRGYCVWSLLDNFEWAEGYRQRFGLVHVDFATQRRTPRTSFHWYRDLIAGTR